MGFGPKLQQQDNDPPHRRKVVDIVACAPSPQPSKRSCSPLLEFDYENHGPHTIGHVNTLTPSLEIQEPFAEPFVESQNHDGFGVGYVPMLYPVGVPASAHVPSSSPLSHGRLAGAGMAAAMGAQRNGMGEQFDYGYEVPYGPAPAPASNPYGLDGYKPTDNRQIFFYEPGQASSAPTSSEPVCEQMSGLTATESSMQVEHMEDGVTYIGFEYARCRGKRQYRVRCDVQHVDEKEISYEFRLENCVYPKAMVSVEEYKGYRYRYESDCNELGWRLAFLNPELRGRRGLIQRAVDTCRNSSQDSSLRSRRNRRLTRRSL